MSTLLRLLKTDRKLGYILLYFFCVFLLLSLHIFYDSQFLYSFLDIICMFLRVISHVLKNKEIMRRVLGRISFASLAGTRLCSTKMFTDSHEWMVSKGDEVTLGITNYAQQNLGDVVYVSLPQVGDAVVEKDVIGEVESVKATSNVYTPVGGTITAVNEKLKDEPGLINKSAEDLGWLVKLKKDGEPKDVLMSLKEYEKYVE